MEPFVCPVDDTHTLEAYTVNPHRLWCDSCKVSYSIGGLRRITLSDPEPPPIVSKEIIPATWDLVMEDMKQRDKFGEQKYGVRLRAKNGRKSLVDAYQEALDLVVYLRAAIYERDGQ